MSEAAETTWEDQIAALDLTDPEALATLEKLGREISDAEKAEGTDAEITDDATEAPAETVTPVAKQDEIPPKAEEGAPSGVQEKPQGVQAKDGKHVIPYSVLERERDRAARAESVAQTLAEQLKQLQAGRMPMDGDAEPLSEEDLSALDQDLPGVAKAMRAQMAMIDRLAGNLQAIQREQDIERQTRQQARQDEVEAAISANPTLLGWRDAMTRKDNPDPAMWNRAADLDAVLREDPAWADRPVAERFVRVVETVNSLYGTPATPPPAQPKPSPDLKQIADARLKAQAAPAPQTLSDFPGGVPPAQSDREFVDNASILALDRKYSTMSLDQIEADLARLGI